MYFPKVLFIYKVFLTFESVDEILWCDHSNESYWAVLSYGTVYCAVRGGTKVDSVDEIFKNPQLSFWKLPFESADEILYLVLAFFKFIFKKINDVNKMSFLTCPLSLSTFLKHLLRERLCRTEFFQPSLASRKYGKCSIIQL